MNSLPGKISLPAGWAIQLKRFIRFYDLDLTGAPCLTVPSIQPALAIAPALKIRLIDSLTRTVTSYSWSRKDGILTKCILMVFQPPFRRTYNTKPCAQFPALKMP